MKRVIVKYIHLKPEFFVPMKDVGEKNGVTIRLYQTKSHMQQVILSSEALKEVEPYIEHPHRYLMYMARYSFPPLMFKAAKVFIVRLILRPVYVYGRVIVLALLGNSVERKIILNRFQKIRAALLPPFNE